VPHDVISYHSHRPPVVPGCDSYAVYLSYFKEGKNESCDVWLALECRDKLDFGFNYAIHHFLECLMACTEVQATQLI
jgi:hypothetical protein